MTNQAIKFMSNPKKFMSDVVKKYHYDTCHVIKDYDASVCAEDCRSLETQEFAKTCHSNKGLYKCCIR